MTDRGAVSPSAPTAEPGAEYGGHLADAHSGGAGAHAGERDSRLIFVFFFACVLVLLLSSALLLVTAAQSVVATRQVVDFAVSIADVWHSDSSMAVQIMPYVGVFVLALSAPLRRTRNVFWVSMALLFLVLASYQLLVWQTGDGRWIANTMIGSPIEKQTEVLQSFFATIRNGSLVLIASMLGLSVNKDAKN